MDELTINLQIAFLVQFGVSVLSTQGHRESEGRCGFYVALLWHRGMICCPRMGSGFSVQCLIP